MVKPVITKLVITGINAGFLVILRESVLRARRSCVVRLPVMVKPVKLVNPSIAINGQTVGPPF